MMMQCMSQSPMLRGAPVHNERRYVFGFIYISAHIQLSFVFLYIISLLEIFGQGINYSMFCHIHTSQFSNFYASVSNTIPRVSVESSYCLQKLHTVCGNYTPIRPSFYVHCEKKLHWTERKKLMLLVTNIRYGHIRIYHIICLNSIYSI